MQHISHLESKNDPVIYALFMMQKRSQKDLDKILEEKCRMEMPKIVETSNAHILSN